MTFESEHNSKEVSWETSSSPVQTRMNSCCILKQVVAGSIPLQTHTNTKTRTLLPLRQSFNIHLHRHRITKLWLLYSKGMCFPWNTGGKYSTYITDITEINSDEANKMDPHHRKWGWSSLCTACYSLKWWTLLCPTAFHICLYSNSQNCIFFLFKRKQWNSSLKDYRHQ